MRKIVSVLLVALIGLMLVAPAQAIPVSFVDVHDAYIFLGDRVIGPDGPDEYIYTHNIITHGFNPATDTLMGAFLALKFCDPGFDCIWDEWVTVELDSNSLFTQNFEVDAGTVTIGGLVTLLQNDGLLTVKLTVTDGGFGFKKSTLIACGYREMPEPTVAAPGALVLLASGLIGVGGYFRKKRK